MNFLSQVPDLRCWELSHEIYEVLKKTQQCAGKENVFVRLVTDVSEDKLVFLVVTIETKRASALSRNLSFFFKTRENS